MHCQIPVSSDEGPVQHLNSGSVVPVQSEYLERNQSGESTTPDGDARYNGGAAGSTGATRTPLGSLLPHLIDTSLGTSMLQPVDAPPGTPLHPEIPPVPPLPLCPSPAAKSNELG
jgi:hypothetical protein